jgi:predicted XRE-type DNA-binding protein
MGAMMEQGVLPLARSPRAVQEVTDEVISRKKDLMAAINLCIDISGLENKEIAIALGIDAGHFSNIRAGKTNCHFPTNKLDDLMSLCGNEIPLQWQAMKRGKGLHMLESEAQRQLRIERDARMEAEKKLAYLEDLYKSR